VLPELSERLSKAWRGAKDTFWDATPTELGLSTKGIGDISFDTVNIPWYRQNGYERIYAALSGGLPAWSGEPVSLATSMNHSVVWACNRIISETQGSTPLNMLQRRGGVKQLAVDHPMYSAMANAPNGEMSAMSFQETRTSHCCLRGNAFAQIIRRSGTGTAIQLRALDPGQVAIAREKAGQKRLVYVVSYGVNDEKTFTVDDSKPQDILHIRGIGDDGVRGYSVINFARQSIGTALAVERNLGRFYANGGRVPYVLEMEKRFAKDQDYDQFRADWTKTITQPHLAPILEPGMTYKQTGLNFADAQMLETRLFDIHEICRWFLISPHLVGDLSRATFSNIEQLALEFVKVTMQPWFTRWEQDLWRCVLTPEEKHQGFYFKHNTAELLRGDFLTRMQGYSIMLQNGLASRNELRDLEDWNAFVGGDSHTVQLNMQTIPPDGILSTPGENSPDATVPADGSQDPSLVRVSE
jgi:HK97 family phage portal protein